jgi:hypothetical protein
VPTFRRRARQIVSGLAMDGWYIAAVPAFFKYGFCKYLCKHWIKTDRLSFPRQFELANPMHLLLLL